MQPNPLCIISSHSNKPLQNTNWHVSITADVAIPINSAFHHLTLWFNIIGSSNPIGISRIQFNKFSFSSPLSPFRTLFHDQNSSSLYCRSPGIRVNTVEPNTTPRNKKRSKPATACDSTIRFFNNRLQTYITIIMKEIKKRLVHELSMSYCV